MWEDATVKYLVTRLVDRELAAGFPADKLVPMVEETVQALNESLKQLSAIPVPPEQIAIAQHSAKHVLQTERLEHVQLFTATLAVWMDTVRGWPTPAATPDVRRNTILEGRDVVYKYHEGQVLRLVFANPLPVPELGHRHYPCAECGEALMIAYQSVDLDGVRDRSSYHFGHPGRSGYNLCATCAANICRRAHARVQRRVQKCAYGGCTATGGGSWAGALEIRAAGFAPEDGAGAGAGTEEEAAIAVRCAGTVGMHAVAAVLPLPHGCNAASAAQADELPRAFEAGRRPPGAAAFLTTEQLRSEDCTICAEPLLCDTAVKGPPVTTPCQHSFHTSCIGTMRRGVDGSLGSTECPNCRKDLSAFPPVVTSELGEATLLITRDTDGNPLQKAWTYEVVVLLCQDSQDVILTAPLAASTLVTPPRPSFWDS
eukprot:Rhum_TRINITY_DN19174_c0_g1::Rhum_TRINITY_DN19174_c0_g1_i1::g.169449::m.169449